MDQRNTSTRGPTRREHDQHQALQDEVDRLRSLVASLQRQLLDATAAAR